MLLLGRRMLRGDRILSSIAVGGIVVHWQSVSPNSIELERFAICSPGEPVVPYHICLVQGTLDANVPSFTDTPVTSMLLSNDDKYQHRVTKRYQ